MKKKGDCFRSIDENIAFAGPLKQYKTKINNNKIQVYPICNYDKSNTNKQ